MRITIIGSGNMGGAIALGLACGVYVSDALLRRTMRNALLTFWLSMQSATVAFIRKTNRLEHENE